MAIRTSSAGFLRSLFLAGSTERSPRFPHTVLHSTLLAVSFLLFLAASSGPASAQQLSDELETEVGSSSDAVPGAMPASPFAVPPARAAIVLDGIVSEEEWGHVPPLPMTTFSPAFREPPTERTEIRVTYDDRYLYVSGRMYDSEPDQIRTNTFYRDQYSSDDIISVILDSYNDRETGVWFMANPAGTRTDRTLSNDAIGGMNADWNAHWDVATRQTDEGWFAEFRIPFSSLGFQPVDGKVTMGLVVYRYIPRKNERHTFPVMDPEWAGQAFVKPSRAHRIVFEGIEPERPVYVTPYTLGALRQLPEPRTVPGAIGGEGGPGGTDGWKMASETTGEVGADLRFAPSSNLTLDFTLNTDFAQVEADNQQINLTRFPVFFPEKRQFFQERSSTLQFDAGGGRSRLFHSRRIGLDQGEIVRIYGGGRAVGRIGGTDFGFLAMQTASHDGVGSETSGVARISQRVLNPYSSVGGMLTTRLGTGGTDNVGIGLDAALRLIGDEWLTVKWARTFDETLSEATTLDAGVLEARWERVRDGGLSYRGQYIRVGDSYLPRLGFQARSDFQLLGGQLQYKRYHASASSLRSTGLQASGQQYLRLADGTAQSRSISPELSMEFKGGGQLSFSSSSAFESIRQPFAVADAQVEPGEYWFHQGEARYQLARSSSVRGSVSASAGGFYDGQIVGVAVSPTWNQSRFLELDGRYEVNRLSFPDRDLSTTAHLLRLNLQAALNTRISASTLAQYSNVAELVTFNARFRYHFREGTDFWLVYNEGMNVGPDFGAHPLAPRSSGRSVMVKYTRALIW